MEQLERWILISLQRWKMHLKLLFAAIHSQMFRAFQNIKILSSSSPFLVRQRNHSNSHPEGSVILILLLGHWPVEEEEWAMLMRQCWKKIYLDARMDARPAGKWVSCPTPPPRDPWNTLAAPPCPVKKHPCGTTLSCPTPQNRGTEARQCNQFWSS